MYNFDEVIDIKKIVFKKVLFKYSRIFLLRSLDTI